MRTSITFVLAVVCAVAGAQTPGVPGPCLPNMDDGFNPGLNGSCCSVVMNPLLPTSEIPPNIHMPGQYAVFRGCKLEAVYAVDVVASLSGLFTNCDEPCFQINVSAAGPGAPTLSFLAPYTKYSRRYALANGMMRTSYRYITRTAVTSFGAAAAPLAVPPCLGPHPDVPFTGHVDFSCGLEAIDGDALQPAWRYSLSLHHVAGCVSHAQFPANLRSLAPASPGRHDDLSYHLVAPAPFTFLATPFPDPDGVAIPSPSQRDAIRSTRSHNQNQIPPPIPCITEHHVTVRIDRVNEICFCTTGDPIFYVQTIPLDPAMMPTFNVIRCPSSLGGMGIGVQGQFGSPAQGFVQQYVGRWPSGSDPAIGGAALFTNFGQVDYADPCPPNSNPPFTTSNIHLVYGVSTVHPQNGMDPQPVLSPGNFLATLMTDFVNSVDASSLAQVAQTGANPLNPANIVFEFSK